MIQKRVSLRIQKILTLLILSGIFSENLSNVIAIEHAQSREAFASIYQTSQLVIAGSSIVILNGSGILSPAIAFNPPSTFVTLKAQGTYLITAIVNAICPSGPANEVHILHNMQILQEAIQQLPANIPTPLQTTTKAIIHAQAGDTVAIAINVITAPVTLASKNPVQVIIEKIT